jgi:hypothetical protein
VCVSRCMPINFRHIVPVPDPDPRPVLRLGLVLDLDLDPARRLPK